MTAISKRLRDKCDRKFINALCEEAAAELDRMEAALMKARKFIDYELPCRGKTMVAELDAALAGKEGP